MNGIQFCRDAIIVADEQPAKERSGSRESSRDWRAKQALNGLPPGHSAFAETDGAVDCRVYTLRSGADTFFLDCRNPERIGRQRGIDRSLLPQPGFEGLCQFQDGAG